MRKREEEEYIGEPWDGPVSPGLAEFLSLENKHSC